jgi:hypothetical protein
VTPWIEAVIATGMVGRRGILSAGLYINGDPFAALDIACKDVGLRAV